MTGLSRTVLTVVTACVTLAVGIALGNGPLQGDEPPNHDAQLSRKNAELSTRIETIKQRQTFDQKVAAATVGDAVSGVLQDQAVTLVVLPDVSDETVDAMQSAITEAGGSTAVTVRLTDKLVAPGQKTYVGSVADNALRKLPDVKKQAGDSPYDQIGAALSRAYVGHSDELKVDDVAVHIDGQLQGAKLVTINDPVKRRGHLVLALASGAHATEGVTSAKHTIEAALLNALASGSDGLVAVAPPTARFDGGLFDVLANRSATAQHLSTVNVIDSPAGQVAAVYALAAAADGDFGSYGIDNGQAELPPGMGTSTK